MQQSPRSEIETIRTIKRGHIYNTQPGVKGEIQFIEKLFPVVHDACARIVQIGPNELMQQPLLGPYFLSS